MFNSYKIIANKNNIEKDSVMFLNFDYFNPQNNKIMKRINRINICPTSAAL